MAYIKKIIDKAWSEAEIAGMDSPKISILMLNAERRGNLETVGLCQKVLNARASSASPQRKPNSARTIRLAHEVSSDLSAFAAELSREFDLSKETAIRLSAGIPRYKPHSIAGKDGKAKIGGWKRKRLCDLDTYISYRLKNDVLTLGAWLGKGRPEQELEYQVMGSSSLFESPLSHRDLRPGIPAGPEALLHGYGVRFSNPGDAKKLFHSLLLKIGAPRLHRE
jgi:hypothetical protein